MMTVHKRSLAAIALLAFAGSAATAQSGPAVVAIGSGKVAGVAADGVIAWKGIPFAAPPLGKNRWRAPQPVQKWSGVLQAKTYGHDCMQIPFPSDAAPLGAAPSEDCLMLNVWRPANVSAKKLPVLVWIYGGGFVNGGSSPSVYDGSAFARQGVIMVSFNYRLGRFGFFAHPSLTAAKEGPLGNYAYMDQIAALKWVKQNIAAFGGDAGNVTIMGESAGGASVLSLMASPPAQGLFNKAIVMSGGGRSLIGGRPLSSGTPEQPSAEEVGVNFAKSVGIEGTGAQTLAALRALPAEKILGNLNMAAMFAPQGPVTYVGGPVVDGTIVPLGTEDAVRQGKLAHIPLLIGSTSADLGFAFAPDKDQLFASFGADAQAARAIYDPDGKAALPASMSAVGADRSMHEPARYVATEMTKRGDPAWLYRFSYVADSMRKEWPGAPHATDIPYFFDTVAAKYGAALTPKDAAAAKSASAYVANFAKTGNPNGAGLPQWASAGNGSAELMDFSADKGPVLESDPWKARLDIVERAARRQRGQ
jgi:para-nitrobenzyl esterase